MQEHLTKDDARHQFLRILRTLPYGNSVFFAVRKIDDPIGLLPGKVILGINKRGVSGEFCFMHINMYFLLLKQKPERDSSLSADSFLSPSSKGVPTFCRIEGHNAIWQQ